MLLAAVNERGEAYIISLISYTVIHKHRFYRKVPVVKFSPDGRYLGFLKGSTGMWFLKFICEGFGNIRNGSNNKDE